ncbi:MAG: PAS domain S-box protein [Methylococcales bacterium]|jgi:PAS domain S-box-containing protein|nr:PAS domain S-box protein [Methylococcales bacterium]MBT7408932.1 PAS domain S-box protein [Methylococcales bacterium]
MTIENDYQVLQQNLLLKDKVLGVINKVWEVTNSGESPDAIFSQILPMVLPILDCDYGFIAKINHLQSFQLCLKIYAQQCLSENSLQQDEYILYDDLPEEVMVLINSEQNILLNDLVSPLKISVKDTSVELNNLLGIMLKAGGGCVGIAIFANRNERWSNNIEESLMPIFNLCANIIDQNSRHQVFSDIETKLHNVNQKKINDILESTTDAYIALDYELKVQHINQRAAVLFDIGSSSFAEQSLYQILPELFDEAYPLFQKTIHESISSQLNFQDKRNNRWFDIYIYPIETGVCLYCRDISEKVEAEQALVENNEKINAILDTVLDGVLTMTQEGMITTFNPAAQKMFEYAEDEIVNKNIRLLVTNDFDNIVDFYHDNIMQNYSYGCEMFGLKKNGITFPIEVTLTELYLHKKDLYTCVIKDITERKRVDKLKTEFVSTVSHELRTPLTAIKGSLGMITSGVLGVFEEPAKGMLDIALQNSDRLLVLINDLLDIDKIEAGEVSFDMKIQSVVELLKQSIDVNYSFSNQFNIHLKLREPVEDISLLFDFNRLLQVMTNLISNAIKFSSDGAEVIIFIEKLPTSVKICVQDHGTGIAESFKPMVFTKFVQGDSSDTRGKGGTGLGLSISQAIIDAHHGMIGFTSIEREGSTFFFELPIQSEKE